MTFLSIACPDSLRESWPNLISTTLEIPAQQTVINIEAEIARLGITISDQELSAASNTKTYVFGSDDSLVRLSCGWNDDLERFIFSFHYNRQSGMARHLAHDSERILIENGAVMLGESG